MGRFGRALLSCPAPLSLSAALQGYSLPFLGARLAVLPLDHLLGHDAKPPNALAGGRKHGFFIGRLHSAVQWGIGHTAVLVDRAGLGRAWFQCLYHLLPELVHLVETT